MFEESIDTGSQQFKFLAFKLNEDDAIVEGDIFGENMRFSFLVYFQHISDNFQVFFIGE